MSRQMTQQQWDRLRDLEDRSSNPPLTRDEGKERSALRKLTGEWPDRLQDRGKWGMETLDRLLSV
jgi:hypothetical protein